MNALTRFETQNELQPTLEATAAALVARRLAVFRPLVQSMSEVAVEVCAVASADGGRERGVAIWDERLPEWYIG